MTDAPVTLLTFRWGAANYGAPLSGVREVVRLRDLVAVPGAAAPLAGLVDLRGHALPVLDLRRALLDLPAAHSPASSSAATEPTATAPDSGRDVLVVQRADGELVGILCDEVLGVSEQSARPQTPAGLPSFVVGVYPGPLPVVDLELLLADQVPVTPAAHTTPSPSG